MAVYKFRVTFEDYEDIYRDIEIRSSHTFLDLHHIILQSINFDTKHAASFFVSDEFWRKGTELTLLEEDLEPGVKLMKNVKIASCIEQPNQRFLYLYDKKVLWSFYIELIKLVPEDVKAQYPRCIKTVGQPPKQYKQQLLDKLKETVKEEELMLDKTPHDDEPASPRIKDEEKLVFDEHENDDLHEDENELVKSDDHEEEPGDDAEAASEHEEEGF